MRSPYRVAYPGVTPSETARSDGYKVGRHDVLRVGFCRHVYRTGAEYLAWLAGWRDGQKELWSELEQVAKKSGSASADDCADEGTRKPAQGRKQR